MTGQYELQLDEDLRSVLEFMQIRVPASKLMAVAWGIHKVAAVLWDQSIREDCHLVSLAPQKPPITKELENQSLSIAT